MQVYCKSEDEKGIEGRRERRANDKEVKEEGIAITEEVETRNREKKKASISH